MSEVRTIGEVMYWAYANLAMTHAAIKDGMSDYGPKYFAIRAKLYKGLMSNTMDMRSFFDDERLKMVLPQACCYCGAKDSLAADHVIPRKKGGQDIGENLVWACRACNSSKRDRDLMSWMKDKDRFPSLLLYRRYLKNVIVYCRENNLIDVLETEIDHKSLPFDLSSIPSGIIPLKDKKIWVFDIVDQPVKSAGTSRYRIANWNVERPLRLGKKSKLALEKLREINADVVALTETSDVMKISDEYSIAKSQEVIDYPGEQRAAIHSKWPIVKTYDTYNSVRSVCAEIAAPFGNILVYGSIIPYHMAGVGKGKYRHLNYKAWQMHREDIISQSEDWRHLRNQYPGKPLIIMGDFNQTRDSLPKGYGTEACRQLLTAAMNEIELICVTEEDFESTGKLNVDPKKGRARRNIDHICISLDFTRNLKNQYIGAWDHFTEDGSYMSDHNGVYLDFDL